MKPKFDMRDHPDKLVWKCCTADGKKQLKILENVANEKVFVRYIVLL